MSKWVAVLSLVALTVGGSTAFAQSATPRQGQRALRPAVTRVQRPARLDAPRASQLRTQVQRQAARTRMIARRAETSARLAERQLTMTERHRIRRELREVNRNLQRVRPRIRG